MAELSDQQTGVIKPVTSQLPALSRLDSVASGNGHPGVAVTDAGRHVCTPEIRMPNHLVFPHLPVNPFVGPLADATPRCPNATGHRPQPHLAGRP